MSREIKRAAGTYQPVATPRWNFLGGERIAMDGSDQQATLPSGTEIIYLRAEDGELYWSINSTIAGANAPGWTPDNWLEALGPISNLTHLTLYGEQGAVAHLQYFKEAR